MAAHSVPNLNGTLHTTWLGPSLWARDSHGYRQFKFSIITDTRLANHDVDTGGSQMTRCYTATATNCATKIELRKA